MATVAIGTFAAPAAAQVSPAVDLLSLLGAPPITAPAIAPGNEDCPGGEIYDDGVAENGYSGNPGTVSSFEAVQLFNPGGGQKIYLGACFGLVSLGGPDLDFEIIAYSDAGGTPGVQVGALAVSVTDIPGALPGAWYVFDVTPMGLNPTTPVFVGVRWNPMTFPSRFIMSDESVATPLHLGFVNFNVGSGWQATESVFPGYRALLVRLVTVFAVPTLPTIMLMLALLMALVVAARLTRGRVAHA
jgi:hypothetical protein